MAKDNNLTDFLKDIADAIRTAEGLDSSVTIPAQEFSDHIQFLGNWEPLQVTPSTERQEFTQAGQGYSAFLPVVVTAMPSGTATTRNRTSGGSAIGYGKEVHLSAGYYPATTYYNSITAGSATGNAGTLTYKSIAQDTSNKKKFTITSTVSAPAPTISSGYITSGTAGTATDRTVVITLTDAQAQAAVGSGTATGNAGTITYVSHTQDSTNKKKFTVTGTVSAPAPTISAGYISSGTDGTGTNRTVSLTLTDAQAQAAVGSGSATTPATTIKTNPTLSTTYTTDKGYLLSVSATKSVTPTVVAGYVASGTAGTITVQNADTPAYVPQNSFAGATVPSGVTPTTLAKNTSYKLSAGYYPSDRYYKTQADPTLSGDAAVGDVLDGKTFYNTNYTKKTGTMTNNGAIAATKNPTFSGATASYSYTVPAGYHNGSGTVSGSVTMSTASMTYGVSGTGMDTYFSAGSSSDYSVYIQGTYQCSTAGYKAKDSSTQYTSPSYYKIKSGSATSSASYATLSSAGSSATTVTSRYFKITPTASVGTAGWISSISNGTVQNYTVQAGSATTPSGSGASINTTLSGTTLTVSRNVTPTIVAGWVSSGTVGTVTITGTVPTQSKSATPSGVSQTISPDSGKLLSSVTVNPPEIEGLCKYQVYTTENRLVSGNSAISPVNLTIDALSSSKTYNIIIMLGGYGWGPTSTSAPNTGGILGLYNVPGNSFPSTITASKTFEANGFGGGSYSSGTFTVSVGVYNSTTIRIATSASGLNNQYPGAAYVDVKMVIIQEVD